MKIYRDRFYVIERIPGCSGFKRYDQPERVVVTGHKARNQRSSVIGEHCPIAEDWWRCEDGHLPEYQPRMRTPEAEAWLTNNPFRAIVRLDPATRSKDVRALEIVSGGKGKSEHRRARGSASVSRSDAPKVQAASTLDNENQTGVSHAPGPWIDRDGYWLIEPKALLENRASARLMGTAPELLSCLEDMVSAFEYAIGSSKVMDSSRSVHAHILAISAIAKARGQ